MKKINLRTNSSPVKVSPQRQVVIDLIRRFPKASTRALARMAKDNNPSVFLSDNSARQTVRSLRGACGESRRRETIDKSHFREIQPQGDPFPKLPAGKEHFEDWGAMQIDGPVRALVLSDIHIPYHDKTALVTALQWGKDARADTIILNGDIADFFSVSFWEKDPRKRRFAEELKAVQAFMETIRDTFPKARIVFKEGNHEERWQRYMFVKAPELLGIPAFEIPEMLGLKDADYVGEKRAIRLGELNVLHGHEYRFMISNPVNPARGLFLRCKAYALCFTAGTTVVCSTGVKNIEDIQRGDLVLTAEGNWKPVVSIKKHMADRTVILKGQGHPGITTTPEHPFLTRTAKWRSNNTRDVFTLPEWTEARDALGTFWASPTEFPEMEIPEVVAIRKGCQQQEPVEMSKSLMRLVGRWLGDGWVSRNQVQICCAHNESGELRAIIEATGLRARDHVNRTSCVFTICRIALSNWLNSHFGQGARAKTVPAWAFGMPSGYRRALLDGYLSADGHRPKRYGCAEWEARTASRKLAVGIKLLAQSLGYSTTLYLARRPRKAIIEGRTVNQTHSWIIKGIREFKRWSSGAVVDGHLVGRIKSVKRGKSTTVYNLTVADDSSYIADGLVVHNCGHFHQSSYHSEKTVEQSKIATWSVGCLCDMHPDYAPYNNWSHGFAFVETEKDGKFIVQNKTIAHGRVF